MHVVPRVGGEYCARGQGAEPRVVLRARPEPGRGACARRGFLLRRFPNSIDDELVGVTRRVSPQEYIRPARTIAKLDLKKPSRFH